MKQVRPVHNFRIFLHECAAQSRFSQIALLCTSSLLIQCVLHGIEPLRLNNSSFHLHQSIKMPLGG